MAVKIRLKRQGRRNRSFFRICVFDGRTRRDGRSIEDLGYYDPHGVTVEKTVSLNQERLKHWVEHGALPSNTILSLAKRLGMILPGHEPTRAKKAAAAS